MKSAGAPKKQFKEKKLFPLISYTRYEQNELIKRAAYLRGMSASSYLLSVVLQDAQEVIDSVTKRDSS